MMRKLFLLQFIITIQKIILNTAIGNQNFLDITQTSYTITIWIQLFSALIGEINQNQVYPLLQLQDDSQSAFQLAMLMKNNDFQFAVKTSNKEENYGIDLDDKNYQWIAILVKCDDFTLNYNIFYPQNKATIKDNYNHQKTRIITSMNELVTIVIYDDYQGNINSHYFIVDQFPFFDTHQFKIQNDLNLIEICSFTRIVMNYPYKGFYIAQFEHQNITVILLYEQERFYLGYQTNEKFYSKLNYSYEIKSQVWMKYKISYSLMHMHIQLEIEETKFIGKIDIQVKQLKYINQMIYSIYNQGSIHSKVLIINKYGRDEEKIEFCYPGCKKCQEFQCWEPQSQIECRDIEYFNQQTLKCELIVSQPFLQVTQDTFIPRCKVGHYLVNRTCASCPSYQGYKCLECIVNTNSWKEGRTCTFSQIVYSQFVSQILQSRGTPDYTIQEDHYIQSRQYNFLRNIEHSNIFLAQTKDIYLIYYDYPSNKHYCEAGFHFKNLKCVRNQFKCQFQYKQCICHTGYASVNNRCFRCQKHCLFCQLQNKQLICIIPVRNYFLYDSFKIHSCLDQPEQTQECQIFGCKVGQFYDILDKSCIARNLSHIQSNMIQYIQYQNFPQDIGLHYVLQNQSLLTNHSTLQLQYQSVIEQIHMINTFIEQNQKNMLDCDQTLYYRNTPYCLKPKQNYLVDNFNQLFYCPKAKQCGYKLIIDAKVQITNRAIIILNDQTYYNFSQIISQITRNIVIIVVHFNISFQMSSYNLGQDYENLFYLEDKYYHQQEVKFTITIWFEQYQFFLNHCDQINFRFHQIIFNNLNPSLGDQCNKNNDRLYLKLIGTNLILNKTNLNNLDKPFTIKFLNSTLTQVLDTKIINCTLQGLLFIFEKEKGGIMTVRNIMIHDSVLNTIFVEIIGATQLKLIDFLMTRSIIREGIFYVKVVDNLNILNMLFRLVQSHGARFIVMFSESSSGTITASDINFYNCDFHKTIILQAKQIINMQQLQFSNTRFNQSCIIMSDRSESISISQFKLQNFTITNSYLLKIQSAKYVFIEQLLMSFRIHQLSVFPLFDIESTKCTFDGVKLNNLDNCFNTNMFLLQRLVQVIINDVQIQGNVKNADCLKEIVNKKNQHLIKIIQARYVQFRKVQLQDSLFCDLGFIYVEFEQLELQSFQLKNLSLNQLQMQQSFIYYEAVALFSENYLESIKIDQIHLQIVEEQTLLQFAGFNSKINVVNFQIQNVNSTRKSYVFGATNSFLFIERLSASRLISLLVLKSENCAINVNSSIISKVIDYGNLSSSLFFITSNYYQFYQFKMLDVEVYELQNQLIFVQPQLRVYHLVLRNIQINMNLTKSDVIVFSSAYLSNYQQIRIINIIFNILNYNITLDHNLFNLVCKEIQIHNITVNQLTSGFLHAISSSLKISHITIKNSSQQSNVFHLTQHDFKSVITLTNIFITSYSPSQLQTSSIKILQRNSLVRIQDIHIQNTLQSNIIQIFQTGVAVQNQFQRNFIRNSIFNNIFLNLDIIQVIGQIKIIMEDLILINIKTNQLFKGAMASFHIMNSSIIKSTSNLGQIKNNVQICNSQVVDGQIRQSNINFLKTYIFNINQDSYDKFYSKELQLFLSLNGGKSYFLNQFKNQYYHVLLKEGNEYLYMPSGQLLKQFQYLNVKQQVYEQLYESITIVLKDSKSDITYKCIFKQLINAIEQNSLEINLQQGLSILDNITFTSNPYQNHSIQCILTCSHEQELSNLTFQVRTFPCQLGEYLFQNQCLVCDIDKNYYSVSYKATNCLIKENSKILDIKKGQIKLIINYWRYQLHNKFIEKCEDNCNGGWKVGDHSCNQGHIGALCKECDIYNTRGQGYYGLDGDKCQICQFDYTLIIKGLLISFWQIILAYMSYSTNTQISNQFLFNKINNRKLSIILDRQNINQVSVMLKLISNYLYAVYLIKDNFQLGNYIDWSLNLFNNPNMIISPQLDCMLAELIPIDVSYSIVIYRFLTPFLVLNMFFLIFIVLIYLKQSKYDTKVVLIIIYSIYMFNQQLILQSLLKQLSYKFYSNIAWVYQNLSIMYYSDSHKNMLYKLVIPLSICFWMIPFAIFIYLWKINRSSFKSQKQLGYIYREYNQNCYYWEMIRIYYNFLLMTILYVFNQKLFLTLILCQTFLLITQYKQPYSLNNLNRIDSYILLFASFSFIIVFYGDKQDDILIRYSIIIFCNILLFQHLIRQITGKVRFAYEKDIVIIEQTLTNKFPKISKYLDVEKKKQIKSKIQKLRSSVKLKSFILQSPILAQPTIILQGEIEMQEIK